MIKYVFKPYDANYPKLFKTEKQRLASKINIPYKIEHIGSTAVPGLGGKGIIDIMIAVDKSQMKFASGLIQELGYEFGPLGGNEDRLFHMSDPQDGSSRFHLHLTHPDSKDWSKTIKFRDYLISHPEKAQEYAEIKQKAALEVAGDGEKYRKLKEPFIEEILNRQ